MEVDTSTSNAHCGALPRNQITSMRAMRSRASLAKPRFGSDFKQRGKVRRSVNERRRCNLRFATRTSGAINARTEGDTAREREEHRVGGHVKPDVGDVGGLRPAEHATVLQRLVGEEGRRPLGARPV